MTTRENTPSDGDLAAENTRLRMAVASLSVFARAVLDCRDNGGLQVAREGYPAYQASHALLALEDCVTKAIAGDWRPLRSADIEAAFHRHRTHVFLCPVLRLQDFSRAVDDLLWHPIAHGPRLPVDGTADSLSRS